jgi:hypothetical protein
MSIFSKVASAVLTKVVDVKVSNSGASAAVKAEVKAATKPAIAVVSQNFSDNAISGAKVLVSAVTGFASAGPVGALAAAVGTSAKEATKNQNAFIQNAADANIKIVKQDDNKIDKTVGAVADVVAMVVPKTTNAEAMNLQGVLNTAGNVLNNPLVKNIAIPLASSALGLGTKASQGNPLLSTSPVITPANNNGLVSQSGTVGVPGVVQVQTDYANGPRTPPIVPGKLPGPDTSGSNTVMYVLLFIAALALGGKKLLGLR